jgi:hypothetical protein
LVSDIGLDDERPMVLLKSYDWTVPCNQVRLVEDVFLGLPKALISD